MSVYKLNGRFYMKGRLYQDDGNFKYYNKAIKGCTSIVAARKAEEVFLLQQRDLIIGRDTFTFREVCDAYLKSIRHLKKSGIKLKSDRLNRTCRLLGDKKIGLIKRRTIQNYIDSLYAKNYSNSYVESIYYTITPVFAYAIKEGYIDTDPSKYVELRKDKDKIDEELLYITSEQFNDFISVVDERTYYALFSVLYYMGCRRGEALALTWNDIDFDKGMIRIYKSMSYALGKPTLTTPKTKNSYRNISMPSNLIRLLKEYKLYCMKIYGFSDEMYVFGFDKPLATETLRRRLKKYIALANEKMPADHEQIPDIHIHTFRHSHASYLINNMSDQFTDFDIAKRLGDTVAMLHSTYAHWFKQGDKGIIGFMDSDVSKDKTALSRSNSRSYEELKELKELLDMGILTEEEFTIKKKQILEI